MWKSALQEAYEDRRPGCCLACDEPITQTPGAKERKVHADPECQRVYHSLYGFDRRKSRPQEHRDWYARNRESILRRARERYRLAKRSREDTI
jgi:hypothetical protein